MDDALTVRNARAGYGGAPVLRGASLRLGRGEIVGLMGPNGAGKTTLLQCVAGLLPLDDGSIELDGQDVRDQSPLDRRLRGLGYVAQERNVFPNLSVLENLQTAFGVAARKGGQLALAEQVKFAFRLFPRLEERRHQQAGLMSGGEQRMVAIAIGLVLQPAVLLLDEPTTGLAPVVVHDLMATIKSLRAASGMSILLVEQNIVSMLRLVDRLYVMKEGHCREFDGDPRAVEQQNIWEYL